MSRSKRGILTRCLNSAGSATRATFRPASFQPTRHTTFRSIFTTALPDPRPFAGRIQSAAEIYRQAKRAVTKRLRGQKDDCHGVTDAVGNAALAFRRSLIRISELRKNFALTRLSYAVGYQPNAGSAIRHSPSAIRYRLSAMRLSAHTPGFTKSAASAAFFMLTQKNKKFKKVLAFSILIWYYTKVRCLIVYRYA